MIAAIKRSWRRPGPGLILAALVAVSRPALAALPSDDVAAVADLTALLQKQRVDAGLAPLTVQPLLTAVAAGRAVALSGDASGDASGGGTDVQAVLAARHYIAMQVVVLDARAGAQPTQALAVWQGDPATAAAALTPGLSEVGVMRMANPQATGPNDAYVWEVVLAQPLAARPEQ